MNEIRNNRANILRHLQAVDSSFGTIIKPLGNEIGETFC